MAFLALFCLFAGCESKPKPPAEPGIVAASTELPDKPLRIVSLAPNITEILFALDVGERVVAVTRFCDFPTQVKELPKIGGVVDPDVENIAAQRPDFVIGVTSGGDPGVTRALDTLKIPYAFLKMETLDETLTGILTISKLVGADQNGKNLHDDMRARIEKITARKSLHKHKTLVVFGHKPIVGAGPGTFAHDLIELAGGQNVLADYHQAYPTLDVETVIKLNPDRILDITMQEESSADFWAPFDKIEAVHSGNVYRSADPALMRPGPRLVESLQIFGMAIHGKHTAH